MKRVTNCRLDDCDSSDQRAINYPNSQDVGIVRVISCSPVDDRECAGNLFEIFNEVIQLNPNPDNRPCLGIGDRQQKSSPEQGGYPTDMSLIHVHNIIIKPF